MEKKPLQLELVSKTEVLRGTTRWTLASAMVRRLIWDKRIRTGTNFIYYQRNKGIATNGAIGRYERGALLTERSKGC